MRKLFHILGIFVVWDFPLYILCCICRKHYVVDEPSYMKEYMSSLFLIYLPFFPPCLVGSKAILRSSRDSGRPVRGAGEGDFLNLLSLSLFLPLPCLSQISFCNPFIAIQKLLLTIKDFDERQDHFDSFQQIYEGVRDRFFGVTCSGFVGLSVAVFRKVLARGFWGISRGLCKTSENFDRTATRFGESQGHLTLHISLRNTCDAFQFFKEFL